MAESVHPQSLLMSQAGLHLLDADRPVSGTSMVFVLVRLGVGESAARSVLQRVTARGLIARRKDGRRTFYALTDRGRAILSDGRAKMYNRWCHGDWDGRWTFVDVTVPESRRKVRHQVQSRLGWAGFARTESGMWVAPGEHDVLGILGAGREQTSPLAVVGTPLPPTTDAHLVASFELAEVAAGFRAFAREWGSGVGAGLDSVAALVMRVKLHEAWLRLTRADPQLPRELLPADWPGPAAGDVFRARDEELAELEAAAIDAYFAGTLE